MGITPKKQPVSTTVKDGGASEWIIHLIAALLLVGVFVAAWSNHFGNGFHFDDENTIVNNEAVHHLSNVPKFFKDPTAFSTLPEHADYRPVLSTLFAIDEKLGGGPEPFVYQAENFVWLLFEVLCVYLLALAVPGVTHPAALFAAAICAVHPALADVVNYPLQRSVIIGGAGLCGGLWLWIAWPRYVPAELPMKFYQFPRNRGEEILRRLHPPLKTAYPLFLKFTQPVYLIPVIFAMLAEPSVAVFPLLLLLWIVFFENGAGKARVIPSAVICLGYGIFQMIWILRITSAVRLPAFSYWYSQPWVATRFVMRYLFPVHLSATMDLAPMEQMWSPLALAGYAGLALVLVLAVITARRQGWGAVSFGLWWFLITFAPQALVPQTFVGADSRILIPMVGLAIATCATCLRIFEGIAAVRRWRPIAEGAAWTVSCLLIAGFAWKTYQRSQIWITDETLWQDVTEKNPGDGVALLNYGQLLLERGDLDRGFQILSRGAALMPDDPTADLMLARANSRLNRDEEAEKYFRKALRGKLSRPWSEYGEWLEARGRHVEALKHANIAISMNRQDVVARHIAMEEFSQNYEWDKLTAYANETLALAPLDEASKRSLVVADVAREEIKSAEKVAKKEPSLNSLLGLSVTYIRNRQFEKAIQAAQKAIELDPAQPFAYSNLSAAYHALGKTDDSIAALREGLKRDPNLPGAKANLEYELSAKASGH